ncbi:hypothetical protein EJB05_30914, partial [Eragrostis curvula]
MAAALWMAQYDADWSSPLPAAAAAAMSDDDAAAELRRGPWTAEEDEALASYVAAHGEGRWNELAVAAGLRRTGKSCRLRWLNYLRPGVRRGGFTPREQLLILDLHARWGNRWSKIAAELPGRTDNEVKNYWRTRVQKHAKQLGCDVASARFHDVVRHHWVPRLIERIQADAAAEAAVDAVVSRPATTKMTTNAAAPSLPPPAFQQNNCASPDASCVTTRPSSPESSNVAPFQTNSPIMTAAAGAGWSSLSTDECQYLSSTATSGGDMFDGSWSDLLARATSQDDAESTRLQDFGFCETVDNFWSLDDIWRQQLC